MSQSMLLSGYQLRSVPNFVTHKVSGDKTIARKFILLPSVTFKAGDLCHEAEHSHEMVNF